MDDAAFWKMRSKGFNNLEWVKHNYYLKKFLFACKPSKDDNVLDVGTGSGVVADALLPFVNRVVGLDFSLDMLSKGKWGGRKIFVVADARKMPFADKTFDLASIRSVLHHITPSPLPALKEVHRVLKNGGRIVVSEGVPPSNSVFKQYEDIFSIKEKRILFREGDVEKLLIKAGFNRVSSFCFWIRKRSVRNWLQHSGLRKKKQEEISHYLAEDPRWFWVLPAQGAIDLLCVMWVKSLSEFHSAVDELLSRYGNYIREHGEQVATNVAHLQQRFLLGGGERKRIDIRETSERVEIDGLDRAILRALADNARMPLVEIAERVGESDKVVAYRIKRMEKQQLIVGYRANLNTKKLGFIWYKIWMRAKKRPKALMRRIASNPNVSYVVEEIGLPEELDFEIMVEKTEELFGFIKELRDKFPTVVGPYRTFMYTETKKVRYIPF